MNCFAETSLNHSGIEFVLTDKQKEAKGYIEDAPFCSICIANYNGEKFIEACITSVLEQDIDLKIEILVHDDASTDNSVSFIKSRFPEVILIESTQNVGFCRSNNRMVDQARGRFILLLNNDAALRRDALRTLHMMYEKHGEGIYGLPQYNMQTGTLIDRGRLLDPFYNPVPNTNYEREDVATITGACLFISKDLWRELGGFPSWFDSLAEDLYICSLARLRGYSVKVAFESGFDHWIGKSLGGGKVTARQTLSTNFQRRAKSERNKTFAMAILIPAEIFLPLLCLHLSTLCIEGILLTLFKCDRKIWSCIYKETFVSLYKKKSFLMSCRKNIQVNRNQSFLEYCSVCSPIPHKLRMFLKYGTPKIS